MAITKNRQSKEAITGMAKMAQNVNGSEPLVVCGKKGEKDMRGMEMWRKSNRFYERNVSRQSDIYCELELLVVGLV